MKPFPRTLLEAARHQLGIVTAQDLAAARIIGRARTTAIETGQLVPVHRGVYRLSSHVESFENRCMAALFAAPDAALSGRTAGRILGLRKVFTDDIHILARRSIQLECVTAHRSDLYAEADVELRHGFRVLRPVRLFCDLAWQIDDEALESVLEQMLDRRLVASIQSMRAAARRFIAMGRPGSVRLARVLDGRPSWLEPADSHAELALWRALRARGSFFERQVPVMLDSGVEVHVDLGQPDRRFGIEVDHVTWHGGRLDTQRDKRRDRELLRVGWTVSRVTDDDIDRRLVATVDDLIAISDVCVTRC